MTPGQFAWTSGHDQVVRFDLPAARSFATTFCRRCGAPLPHHTRSGREIVVPAGSLDDDPSLHPQAHIFWESRPGWSCCDDALPHYAEYTDDWTAKARGPTRR